MYRGLAFVLVALAAGGCVDLTEPGVLRCDPYCPSDAEVADLGQEPDVALDGPASSPDAMPGPTAPRDALSDATTMPDLRTPPDAPSDANTMPDLSAPSDAASPDAGSAPDAPDANGALLAVGAGCTIAGQCASGSCAQGVCCSAACDGLCRSCALMGSVGTCSLIPAGGNSLNRCQDMGPASCGSDGLCDGVGQCRLYAAATVCAAGSCSDEVETSPRTCDGRGLCNPAVTSNCAPQLCAAAACATTCSGTNGCVPGFSCTAAGSCANLANGLLAHWALDEATNAAVAVDSSGNGFHAVDVGGTTVSPAPDHPARFTNPNARRFSRVDDPTSDSLRVVNPGLRLSPLNWTISAWFRSTNIDRFAGTIVNMGDNYMLNVGATGNVQAVRRVPGNNWFGCATAGTFLDDLWHHAVGTSTSGGAITAWVDGVKTSCTFTGVQTYDLGVDLFMGRHGNGGIEFDFDGSLDDVRIYDRVLDDAEILALFAGQ
jgi:hypothetical protein